MNDLLQNHHSGTSGPVECLGQTFASDDARRAHFLTLLAEKLQDPTFRKQASVPALPYLGKREARSLVRRI